MGWTVVLYVLLMVTVVGLTVWVFHRNMRPLYSLLHWLDGYVPGQAHAPVPNDTRITEFRRLNEAAQQAVDRADDLFERQKQFIGNASHELQTPLAVLGNRIEWLLDSKGLTEEQMRELFKMQRTLPAGCPAQQDPVVAYAYRKSTVPRMCRCGSRSDDPRTGSPVR